MRTMYDSVNPLLIPQSAQMVAGYVDGKYRWDPKVWNARFPNAVHVRIAVNPLTNDGEVLDVENGDATPYQAPGWCEMRRKVGVVPTVYCSEGAWPTVAQAFRDQNVRDPNYWIAAYPGIGPVLYPGTVAHQHQDAGPYDLSVVADFWPGVDAPLVTGEILEDDEPVQIQDPTNADRTDWFVIDPSTKKVRHDWFDGSAFYTLAVQDSTSSTALKIEAAFWTNKYQTLVVVVLGDDLKDYEFQLQRSGDGSGQWQPL